MFCAHEVGTHLLRATNEELQPWFGRAVLCLAELA
jgi:hypothetical protein